MLSAPMPAAREWSEMERALLPLEVRPWPGPGVCLWLAMIRVIRVCACSSAQGMWLIVGRVAVCS